MGIPNPPIFNDDDPPTDGQVLRWNATTQAWECVTVTAAAIDVPQAHIAQLSAASAVTSSQEATANANAAGVGYLQADQATIVALLNSLKVKYNAAQVDVVALRAEVVALTTALNTALTELQTAGVLSAS